VNVDVGGFREEGDPAVKAMAERLAASAKKMGKVLAVAPISARERRQIHLALVGTGDITTRSEGEGIFRQLLIIPGARGARGEG
jgi:spoIIIJ-associated protein